ncbi:hypothetical protein [Nocardia tengchongensis]
MPKRSNLFQEVMAIVHAHINDDSVTVTESKELVDGITGQLREVDICIERDVPGADRVTIGIECRDHPKRKQTIEWVEQMFGKHYLLTDKLILVSSSGFTKQALAKANALKIHTITPSSSEDLEASLTEQLNSLWAKIFRHVPTALTYVLRLPDGSLHEFRTGIGGPPPPNVYNEKGELESEGSEFLKFVISSVPPDSEAYRDAETGERKFSIAVDRSTMVNSTTGEPFGLYVRESSGQFLARIESMSISGIVHVSAAELPLTRSTFGEVNYSYGSTTLDGNKILIVSTQKPGAEPKNEMRVEWDSTQPSLSAD